MYFLPILLISPKKYIQYFFIISIVLLVASSFKRGGVISLLFSIIVYFYLNKITLSGSRNKFIGVFSVIIIVITLSFIFVKYDATNDNVLIERIKNIEQDQGSGRVEVWHTTVDMIVESSFDAIILGHGYNAVQNNSPLKLSAHNDFLEVLYDFGIIALLFYIVLHLYLIKYTYILIKHRSYYAPIMAMSYLLFLLTSLVAHVIIYVPFMSIFAIKWGYIIRCVNQESKSKNAKYENRNFNLSCSL
jgi:O-antigen ligase